MTGSSITATICGWMKRWKTCTITTTTARKTARIDIRCAASSSSLGGSPVGPGRLAARRGGRTDGQRARHVVSMIRTNVIVAKTVDRRDRALPEFRAGRLGPRRGGGPIWPLVVGWIRAATPREPPVPGVDADDGDGLFGGGGRPIRRRESGAGCALPRAAGRDDASGDGGRDLGGVDPSGRHHREHRREAPAFTVRPGVVRRQRLAVAGRMGAHARWRRGPLSCWSTCTCRGLVRCSAPDSG